MRAARRRGDLRPNRNTGHRRVGLAWLLIVGSAGVLLLAYLFFAGLAKSYYGPQSVAAGFDTVWVYSQSRLWRLSASGVTLARYEGKANGLGKVVDAMVAFGPNRVLLHDFEARSWRDCRAGESGVALDCSDLFTGPFAMRNAAEGAVALAPDGQRWVFADFSAGDLLLFDGDRNLLAQSKGPQALDGGTALWLEAQEIGLFAADRPTLLVAEAGARNLTAAQPRWELSAEDAVSKGYVWAAAWGGERRGAYVAYSATRRATHQLWRVDREGRRTGRIDLGGGEPAQIVALDKDTVLVPDVVRGRVHRLSWSDDRVTEFGDETFRVSMARANSRHGVYEALQIAAMALFVIVPIGLGAFFAIRQARRDAAGRGEAPVLPALDPEAEFWFAPDERQVALHERLVLVQSVAVAIVLYLQLRIFGPVFKIDPRLLGIVTILLVVATVVIGLGLWWRQHQRGARGLGRKGDEVLFDGGEGVPQAYALGEVLTDGKRILVGRELLPLRSEGLGLHAEWNAAELHFYLLRDLPPSAYRTTQHLHGLFLRRNPLLLWALMVPLILALLGILSLAFAH